MRSVGCHFKPIAAWLQYCSSAVFWYGFILRATLFLNQMVIWAWDTLHNITYFGKPWRPTRHKLRHIPNQSLYMWCGRSMSDPPKSLNLIMKNLNFYTKTQDRDKSSKNEKH
jgi:hypothetical protein